MLYLAELTRKEVSCGDTIGLPTVYYDNLTRKCALKIGEQLYAVGKIASGNEIKIENANNLSSTCASGECERKPFGEIYEKQPVYDLNGKFLGELENAEFTPKLTLKKLWVKDVEFARGQIYSVGDAIIIKAKTPRQLLRQSAPRKKTQKTATTATPAQADATSQAPIAQTAVTALQFATKPTGRIRRRYGDFNFLLGKVVDKTIVNFQGEVMIKKTEKVTKEVLRQAKISGKLIELCLHVE